MTEYLFKLKKCGKTVGFMCIKDGCVSTCSDPWDTAYPFVTKDKNGKDVFAGDRVKAHEEIGVGHHEEFEGEVYLDEKTTFYRICKVRGIPIYQTCCIELIEDKSND